MKLHKSKSWLKKRYLEDKKTIEQMAIEAGVNPLTIRRALIEFGLYRKI